ncbi:MAG: M56 family metallopeptidase [Thermoguttaceae bacterium]
MTQQYALVSLLTTISKAQPILVDAAIKGAILLLVAGLFTLAMRRASAAQRHLVWLLALGSTLALPMFSVFLPSWRILPRWACRSATAMVKPTKIESTKIESTRAPQPIVDDPPVEVKDSTDAYRQKRAAPGVTSTNISSPPVPATQPAWWARLDWEQGLMAVWVLGMAALVFRYLLGVTFVRRIGREARPIKDEGWLTVLSDTARSLVIRQSVMLLESPRCVMPMTWGIVGPVVLLPAKTHTWPVERRRVVLSHELAHVKRRDCLAQLIAQTVRAVYWFNPLVWLAWRRMLAESEQACDDLVLTQGSKASDYAEHLLTVASGSKADTLLSPAAIAMARSSQLQMRLLAILDERRNRRKVTRIALAAALLVVIGVVVPLSALRAVEENQGRASQALSPNSASSPRIFNPSAETTGAQTQNQLSASGKVIDLSGEPVAGATVYLREWSTLRSSIEPYDWNDINDILATTRTDQRGQFTFQNVSAKPSVYRDYPYPWDIVAMAKGYGLGWQHLRTPKEGRNLTVLLPTQATISGQVVDKSGKPVSSANVKVFFIDQLGSEYYLGDFNAPGRLDLQRSRLAPGGTTDAEGNVTISGLPEDVRLWLTVEDDNHAPAFPFVATTRVPQPDVRVSRYESDGSRRSAEKVFALRFHAVIGPPEPRIIGRVILADNDEPCSGAKISAFANQYDPYGVRGVISQYGDFAITDPSGRFVLRRISQPQYNIRVEPPSPEYLGRQVSVQVPPEKSEVGVEVKLQRGPMLTGQVMAEQGGQGVAGVNVDLYPQPGGKDSAPNQDFSRSVTSDRDGRFRVAVPVGKGKVSISGPVPGYEIPERNHYPEDSRFVREVDIGADKPIPSLRFSVRRGQLPVSPTGAPVLFDSRSGKE